MTRPRSFWLCALLVASAGIGACEEDTSVDSALEDLDPVELEIEAVQNASGAVFEGETLDVELTCDPRIVVAIGPRDGDGRLQNWFMRPTENCGEVEPCGYVVVELTTAVGRTLTSTRAALADVLLDLDGVDLTVATSLRATLYQGQRDEPYEQDGEVVTATRAVLFTAPEGCDLGAGGLGGAPGSGGMPPVDPGVGGAAGAAAR